MNKNNQLTYRKNKHILQKIAKFSGVICIITAFISSGYLLFMLDEHDKVMRAFFGSLAFFCFTVGLVLHYISSVNLPDLTVPQDESSVSDKVEEKQ